MSIWDDVLKPLSEHCAARPCPKCAELRERLDCVREGQVWHILYHGFFAQRTPGTTYNTLDEAIDAQLGVNE